MAAPIEAVWSGALESKGRQQEAGFGGAVEEEGADGGAAFGEFLPGVAVSLPGRGAARLVGQAGADGVEGVSEGGVSGVSETHRPGIAAPAGVLKSVEVGGEERLVERREVGGVEVEERAGDREGLPSFIADGVMAGALPVDGHRLVGLIGTATGEQVSPEGVAVAKRLGLPFERGAEGVTLRPQTEDGVDDRPGPPLAQVGVVGRGGDPGDERRVAFQTGTQSLAA